MKRILFILTVIAPLGLMLISGCDPDEKGTDPKNDHVLYPHTTFDLDEFEATLNEFGKGYGVPDLGTLTRPALPALPEGTLTPVSVSTAQQLTDAAAL